MKWFKHQADANLNAKLQEVILDHGMEGYGLYWFCIELVAMNVTSSKLTFELEHDARIISRMTGLPVSKVELIMTDFINLDLFSASEGRIQCLKLAKRCDDFTAKAIRTTGLQALENKEVLQSPTKSDKVPLEDRSKKVEVRTEVENKKTNRSARFAPPTQQEVFEHMQSKGCGNPSTAEDFVLFYESKNWMVGRTKMSNWKSAATRWVKNNYGQSQQQAKPTSTGFEYETPTERTRRAFAERERQQQSSQDGMVVVDGWGDIPY